MSKGMETRQRFIDSTARLLRRNGYSGTGVLDVIADSGAPRGSLYFHFPGGKEELAIAAMDQANEQVVAWIARTNLRQFFHQYARWIEKTECLDGCPIAALTAESSLSPRIRHAVSGALQSMENAFAAKLRGLGHPDERAQELAGMLVCVFEGAVIQCRARADAQPMRDAYDRLETMLAATVA
ncbi:MAG: TetR/AcrR family transcriptional regulator [Candidatus Dormibacteria bacterium]